MLVVRPANDKLLFSLGERMSNKAWLEKKIDTLETQIALYLGKVNARYSRLEKAILNLKPDPS